MNVSLRGDLIQINKKCHEMQNYDKDNKVHCMLFRTGMKGD